MIAVVIPGYRVTRHVPKVTAAILGLQILPAFVTFDVSLLDSTP